MTYILTLLVVFIIYSAGRNISCEHSKPIKAKVKEIARPVSRIINLGYAFTS